jgi:hypothetical protein
MVINDFHVKCLAVFEAEAHPPLIVDTDAPLAGTISAQLLQPVGAGFCPSSGSPAARQPPK